MILSEKKNDGLKIGQFFFSLIAFLLMLISAASCFAGGLIFSPSWSISAAQKGLLLSLGSLCILLAAIHCTAMVNVFREPKKQTSPVLIRKTSFLSASIALLCWMIVLCLVYFQVTEKFFTSIQPYLTPLAISIPIWWLVEFGKRNLPPVTSRKQSAALSFGASYGVLFIMFLELSVVLFMVAGFLIFANAQAGSQQWMKSINPAHIDTQFLEHYLTAIVQNPWFIAALFSVVGIIAPFLEESLKPAALWVLRKRSLTPVQGFILGLYFGGAFALVENAGMVIQFGAEGWVENILLRASTALLHIACSGLVGWGYARSMQPGKNRAFWKPLLSAFFLHGIWNSLALLFSAPDLMALSYGTRFSPKIWETLILIAIILEWGLVFFLLWKMNRKLKKETSSEPHRNDKGGVFMNEVE